MKRNNYLQHLALENTYIKYRYNELLDNNKKLQTDISDLKSKLDQLYKCHANSILMLQEKNGHLSQMIQEKDRHIQHIIDRKSFPSDPSSLFYMSRPQDIEEVSDLT
jgi:hypothetical protein